MTGFGLLAASLLVLLPSPATAAPEEPFKAQLVVALVDQEPTRNPDVVKQTFSLSGNATPLGAVTGTAVELYNTQTGKFVGAFFLVNKQGDKVFGTVDGALVPTANPFVFENIETFTILGGTGRFAGATGGGDGYARIDFSSPVPPTVVFTGGIRY